MKSINHWFPSVDNMESIGTQGGRDLIFYNSATDEVNCKYCYQEEVRQQYIDKCLEGFELVTQGDAAYNKIMAEIQRRTVNSKKQTSRKKFVNSLISNMKLNEAVIVQRFLNGATEKTRNTGLIIDGDLLGVYNMLLLKRVDDDNFLLGRYLSNYSGWQVAIAHKILPVLASSDKMFWKSTIVMRTMGNEPYLYVVEHIKDKIAYCYLKWPWARKIDKPTYKYQFEDTLKGITKATNYFKVNFDLGPMHNIMIKTFGDRKEMIDQINAFRISYEFTK